MEKPIKKMIIISNCIECPIISNCKSWKKLTSKQRFTLKYSVGISEFILKDCPLDDALLNE